MDVFHSTWSQIGLAVILHILYLEIYSVTCFAWHNPAPTRSQLVPTQSHTVSQRWHQTVPKWYPYNMWKRRKRKDADLLEYVKHVHDTTSRSMPQKKDFMSKYRKLLDKLNRKKQMNNIFKHDLWKSKRPIPKLDSLFKTSSFDRVLSSKNTKGVLLQKHKSHFGGLGSFGKTFSASSEPSSEVWDSGFGDTQAGSPVGSFEEKPAESFVGGFGPTQPVDISTKLKTDGEEPRSEDTLEAGSFQTSKSSWDGGFSSSAGSWDTSDSFGSVGSSSTSGSWGEPINDNNGDVSFGSFEEETKDCDDIDTKTCTDDSECICYGFYTCSNQRCQQKQVSDTDSSSALEGTWHEEPFDIGFSKRDPRRIVQIFMLPWQTQK